MICDVYVAVLVNNHPQNKLCSTSALPNPRIADIVHERGVGVWSRAVSFGPRVLSSLGWEEKGGGGRPPVRDLQQKCIDSPESGALSFAFPRDTEYRQKTHNFLPWDTRPHISQIPTLDFIYRYLFLCYGVHM